MVTVTITNTPAATVALKPANKTVATVALRPASNVALGDLTNVDVAGADNNEVLVFDSANNKFVIAPITLDANTNITNINGGLF